MIKLISFDGVTELLSYIDRSEFDISCSLLPDMIIGKSCMSHKLVNNMKDTYFIHNCTSASGYPNYCLPNLIDISRELDSSLNILYEKGDHVIYNSIKEFVLSMNNTGYITFKDDENSFKEVVVSATSKETLSCELKRCFPRNENEHEYSYEMIYCFYQFYPNETVYPNDTYVGKIDLEIKDDEVLSVKSSLTLKEVDETLNLNLANEKKNRTN